MNEQRKMQREYFNPSQTKAHSRAEELLAEIKYFISKNDIDYADLRILNNLIKQINILKGNINNKVFKSVQEKYERIKKQYQK